MSAAAVISPMLITFLGVDPYMSVGIALASDVLASAVSAYTYHRNKNLDIKNGIIMMISVLVFTMVGSYIASLVPTSTMGGFSVFMTVLLGVKFIVRPVMTTKEKMEQVSVKKADRSIDSMRRLNRFYLRIYRRRRRNDDVAYFNERYGLRIKNRRRNERIHYDVYRSYGLGVALRYRRNARRTYFVPVHGVYPDMGKNRRSVCE